MTEIQPYGPRVAVVDPPAESQRGLELYVPEGYDRVNVGIVMGVGEDVPLLTLGSKVWYLNGDGLEVGEFKIIEARAIIAWEG